MGRSEYMKKDRQNRKTGKQDEAGQYKSGLRENIEAILVAIVLALFIRTFVVQAFKIPSGSMLETLQIGDHILVNKFLYGIKLPFLQKNIISLKEPKREDIVVFKYPEDPRKDFIKRVVGVAGDEIEIRNKKVFVNGKHISHNYAINREQRILPGRRDNMKPTIVPPDSLFVMGDNRDNSHDSRFWGFVNLKAVRGKAFIVYWSWDSEVLNRWKIWNRVRWNRLGHVLK